MNLELDDKVVWITGASGGIGRELARAFGSAGCSLLLSAHSRLAELEARTAEEPFADRALCVAADVTDPEACERAAAAGVERFGRLDVCIANAGAWTPGDHGLHRLDPQRLRQSVSVNLLGSAFTVRAFMGQLERCGAHPAGDGAAVVLIGSTAGRFGERGHSDYAMAKAGLIGLMQSVKNELPELDPWARINTLEPGWTVTEMAREALSDDGAVRRALSTMALRQLGAARDVAGTAVGLASPALSRHVTGQVVTVAGGMEGRQLWAPESLDVERARERSAP